MKQDHERTSSRPRVAEPVQVYRRADEQERLSRFTEALDTTKSDVLRRGLEALEQQITDPEQNPALRVIGILGSRSTDRMGGVDEAPEHDRVLADAEEASWQVSEAHPSASGRHWLYHLPHRPNH